jgi:hypothetical protein
MPRDVLLCVEDLLSEAIGRRLIAHCFPGRSPVVEVRRYQGFGYLRENACRWNIAGATQAILLLTDLDRWPCVPALRGDWFGETAFSTRFLFRVAVRESEAWLLADRDGLSRFLKCSPALIQETADKIADPKALLLALAKRSRRREIREGIPPSPRTIAPIGPRYNDLLCEFVQQHWDVDEAAEQSDSLRRAIAAIRLKEPHWFP